MHPPRGHFLDLDGLRLHYLDLGRGSPIVLLHGNGALAEDFVVSGLAERLARRHRVIIFDRPGHGYSDRPSGSALSPEAQARLFAEAFRRLGLDRPVVVGHSWGALVAAAMGVVEPHAAGGLVLLAGYFYPLVRLDATLAALTATPGLAPLIHASASPGAVRAIWPRIIDKIFAPAPIPARFRRFPKELVLRPSHLAAAAAELPGTLAAVRRLSGRYREIRVPTLIMIGPDDRQVPAGPHSRRLARDIPGAKLVLVPHAGHMIHYSATGAVEAAIEEIAERAGGAEAERRGAFRFAFAAGKGQDRPKGADGGINRPGAAETS